jgi:HSP20 family protein
MTQSLTKKEPAHPVTRFQQAARDLVASFFDNWGFPQPKDAWWPSVDVTEQDATIRVKAELPGLQANDIDVAVRGDVLTISGEKKESSEEKKKDYYHSECSYGAFRRDIPLPAEVNPDKVETAFRSGVLTVTLPKVEKAKPKHIKVKE